MKVYAQMYSLRNECEKDFLGTLKRVAKMGYTGVEFAGYYNTPIEVLAETMKEIGLKTISAHVSLELLRSQLKQELEQLKILGAKYIVCPYSEMTTVESAIDLAKELTEIGRKCFDQGIQLLYHNHDHESKLDQGLYPLEVFFDHVDPNFVAQEVDVYWIEKAGLDAMAYLQAHQGRNPLVHLKQMAMEDESNVAAPAGKLDFHQMMVLCQASAFIYEQEHSALSIVDDMEQSLIFIQHKKGATL